MEKFVIGTAIVTMCNCGLIQKSIESRRVPSIPLLHDHVYNARFQPLNASHYEPRLSFSESDKGGHGIASLSFRLLVWQDEQSMGHVNGLDLIFKS